MERCILRGLRQPRTSLRPAPTGGPSLRTSLSSWLTQDGKSLRLALTTWCACLLATLIVFKVLMQRDQLMPVWPLTGLQLALLLPGWSNGAQRHRGQMGGVLGVMMGMVAAGMPAWFAVTLGCISGLDVWIAGRLLHGKIRTFEDLKSRQNLRRFVLAATLAPTICAFLAAVPMTILLHQTLGVAITNSVLADSLGLGVVFPTAFLILTEWHREGRKVRRAVRAGLPAAAVFLVACGAIFWQTSNPFLFMVFPPMTLVLLALGLEGAAFTSLTLALIACFATAHGHGPMWLVRSSQPEHRLVVLQLFLWMATATALPVGALLDERSRAERETRRAKTIYQTLLLHSNEMMILSSMDGAQRYVSAGSERLTGWTPEEFMAQDRWATCHPEDQEDARKMMQRVLDGVPEQRFQYRIGQKGGGWRWVEATVRAYSEEAGIADGYVGTLRDISSLKQTEEGWTQERLRLDQDKQAMETLALTDALTGLPNRRAFDNAMAEHVSLAKRTGGEIALLMIDVDCFKLYNDRYGHQAGDECLRRIGESLRRHGGRAHDIVARWGGEEFAALLPGAGVAGAERLARAMQDAVRAMAIEHAGSPRGTTTVSIGIAIWDAAACVDPHLWIRAADRALYKSKENGRDRVTVSEALVASCEDAVKQVA